MQFLNIHILFSFAAGNPNRDDVGAPKTVTYGGAIRSRISSQAMTRPKRLSFEAQSVGEQTYRSVLLAEEIAKRAIEILGKRGELVDEKKQADIRKASIASARGLVAKQVKDKAKKVQEETPQELQDAQKASASTTEDQTKKEPDAGGKTLVWLAESEIVEAALKILKGGKEIVNPDTYVSRRTDSLSIAAFGRMFAQRPDLQNEAAIQRAHAFTTHESEIEVDYLTAVDDLRTTDRGAGHINMMLLTGGVYYWHANVDIHQLLQSWSGASKDGALDKLTALFASLFEAMPTGKQNTTGYKGLPSLVLAVPARSAVSLQTAFESPIMAEQKGYLQPSVKALMDEHEAVTRAKPSHFGSATPLASASRLASEELNERGFEVKSLDDLAAWCANLVLDEIHEQDAIN